MFLEQVGEEVQDMTSDFITALEHGMPPAGMGLSIVLVILLTAESIRDTILPESAAPHSGAAEVV